MRLIAERIVGSAAGTTYVDRELTSTKAKPLPPPRSSYHICCSAANPGAAALMMELANERGLRLSREEKAEGSMVHVSDVLYLTEDKECLQTCDHCLLYLTADSRNMDAGSEQRCPRCRASGGD